jgi:Pectate lyase superfamily protein
MPGIDLYMVSAKDVGAVGDGSTDDTAALQDWLDDSRSIKILPPGTYLITASLTLFNGGVRIIGTSRRNSVIKAGSGMNNEMLIIGTGNDTYGGITIDGIGFDGNDEATTGVIVQQVNFSYFNGIGISNVNGTGLDLHGVQDTEFRGIDVRDCGRSTNSKPAVHIHNTPGGAAFDSNSLAFFGGDFENNKYTSCLIEKAYAVSLIRVKMHGITTSPPSVDLLHLIGAKRISVIGGQFAHAGRNSILIEADGEGTASAGVISASTFIEAANYAGGSAEAWHINMVKGRFNCDSNYFAEGTHGSYTTYGGDILLGANTTDIGGVNMHLGQGAYDVKRNYSGVAFSQPSLAGHDYIAENGKTAISVGMNGESYNRLQLQGEGKLRFGGGSAAVDTILERKAASILGLPDGDTWQVEGTYNGGLLRLGAYRLWVDSTGDLRIKNGAPSSDTDGTVVGTQS